jgi:two-component system response regulator HydG
MQTRSPGLCPSVPEPLLEVSLPLALAGGSPAAAAARAAFAGAAAGRGPVLVAAEAGCRPAEVARALHARTRSDAPFMAIDCGADDPREIERRLLGGAARQARAQDLETVSRDSAVVAAGAGTLFLENIDQLPASSQRRLALILRDAEVRIPRLRLPVVTSFRLIAATGLDLDDEARGGRFRTDLLRRLATCRILIPPLRQRTSDIPDIIGAMPLHGTAFTGQVLTVLVSLPWTGNIDELVAVVTRVAAAGGSIRQEDLLRPLSLQRTPGRLDLTTGLREARRQFERDYIAAVLERHRWSMSDAAQTLGIERANLYRKTRQLGITRGSREPWTAGR